MQDNNYKDFCKEVYNNTFNSTFQDLCQKHKSQPTEKIKKDFQKVKNNFSNSTTDLTIKTNSSQKKGLGLVIAAAVIVILIIIITR